MFYSHTIPPPTNPPASPPCFLFEWGYPCERLSFLVLFFSITGTSLNFRRALFNPPLIPFTLSFTSLRAPRRRKRCLCSNYSRPWSDWATPPPTTTTTTPPLKRQPHRDFLLFFSFQCILRFSCLHPEPQKVNGRDVSSLWLLFVSPSSLFSRSIHLSLSSLFLPPVSYVCIPHSCGNKQKKRAPDYDTSLKVCCWCQLACSRVHETFFCGNYQQLQILWSRYSSHCAVRAMQPLFMCSVNLSARRCLLLWLSWRSNWNTVWLVGNKAF